MNVCFGCLTLPAWENTPPSTEPNVKLSTLHPSDRAEMTYWTTRMDAQGQLPDIPDPITGCPTGLVQFAVTTVLRFLDGFEQFSRFSTKGLSNRQVHLARKRRLKVIAEAYEQLMWLIAECDSVEGGFTYRECCDYLRIEDFDFVREFTLNQIKQRMSREAYEVLLKYEDLHVKNPDSN